MKKLMGPDYSSNRSSIQNAELQALLYIPLIPQKRLIIVALPMLPFARRSLGLHCNLEVAVVPPT